MGLRDRIWARGASANDDGVRTRLCERLVPCVRQRVFCEEQGADITYWPLDEHLAVGLVDDRVDHVLEVSSRELEQAGLTLEQALDQACVNLAARSEGGLTRLAAGLYVSSWHDQHDAARLLLPDRLCALPLGGAPVVMVPHRDHLIVAGTDDEVALAAMVELCRELCDAPGFVSSVPLVYREDGWQTFLPPPDHPLHGVFVGLRIEQRLREHVHQRAVLRQRMGEDVFIASLQAMDTLAGPQSYCVWSRGVPSVLLPRADLVALFDSEPSGPPIMVRWDDLSAVAGQLMTAVDGVHPPRYRVQGFPDVSAIEELRRRSVAI